MTYIVAALVGGLAMLAELQFHNRYWFTLGAAGWWGLRILLDAALGVLLAIGLRHLPDNTFSAEPVVMGIVAGLAAPRVVARYSLPVGVRNVNVINVAYQRAAKEIDDNIDQLSAEAQREYCDGAVKPAALNGQLGLDAVATAFRDHIRGRRGFSPVDQAEKFEFIRLIVDDDGASDVEKVAVLILKAWEIGAYASMKSLLAPLPRRRIFRRASRSNR